MIFAYLSDLGPGQHIPNPNTELRLFGTLCTAGTIPTIITFISGELHDSNRFIMHLP
jgi:hypothetical protein